MVPIWLVSQSAEVSLTRFVISKYLPSSPSPERRTLWNIPRIGTSYSRCPVCTWISLPACRRSRLYRDWLSFSRVGFPRPGEVTHWVTSTNFIQIYAESQGFGFTLARGLTGWANCHFIQILNYLSPAPFTIFRHLLHYFVRRNFVICLLILELYFV